MEAGEDAVDDGARFSASLAGVGGLADVEAGLGDSGAKAEPADRMPASG